MASTGKDVSNLSEPIIVGQVVGCEHELQWPVILQARTDGDVPMITDVADTKSVNKDKKSDHECEEMLTDKKLTYSQRCRVCLCGRSITDYEPEELNDKIVSDVIKSIETDVILLALGGIVLCLSLFILTHNISMLSTSVNKHMTDEVQNLRRMQHSSFAKAAADGRAKAPVKWVKNAEIGDIMKEAEHALKKASSSKSKRNKKNTAAKHVAKRSMKNAASKHVLPKRNKKNTASKHVPVAAMNARRAH